MQTMTDNNRSAEEIQAEIKRIESAINGVPEETALNLTLSSPETPLGKILKQQPKRKDWETNSVLIDAAFYKLLDALGRRPTNAEIGIECGLRRETVSSHIQNTDFSKLMANEKVGDKAIMEALRKKAKTGDVAAIRLYKQLTHNFKEGQNINVNAKLDIKTDQEINIHGNTVGYK